MTRTYTHIPPCPTCQGKVNHINSNSGVPTLKCRNCGATFTRGEDNALVPIATRIYGCPCIRCGGKTKRQYSNGGDAVFHCPTCDIRMIRRNGESEATLFMPTPRNERQRRRTDESGWQKISKKANDPGVTSGKEINTKLIGLYRSLFLTAWMDYKLFGYRTEAVDSLINQIKREKETLSQSR